MAEGAVDRGPIEQLPTTRPVIELGGLRVDYGTDRPVLDGVDLVIECGKFVSVVGPSGTGKSSLLRCLAGLQQPSDGVMRADGRPMDGPLRQAAVVFQDYARSPMPWHRVAQKHRTAVALGRDVQSGAFRRRRARPHRSRTVRTGRSIPVAAVRRDATASRHRPGDRHRTRDLAHGRAFRLGGRPDPRRPGRPCAPTPVRAGRHSRLGHARHRRAVYSATKSSYCVGRRRTSRAQISVPLGTTRSSIETKSSPIFAELRSYVLTMIRSEAGA